MRSPTAVRRRLLSSRRRRQLAAPPSRGELCPANRVGAGGVLGDVGWELGERLRVLLLRVMAGDMVAMVDAVADHGGAAVGLRGGGREQHRDSGCYADQSSHRSVET